MKLYFKTGMWMILLSLVSCISSRVSVDKDNQANFKQYRSFNWLLADFHVGHNPLYTSDLIKQNIKNNIEKELKQKGLSYADEADLAVSYHIYTEERQTQVNNSPMMYNPYSYTAGWRYFPYGYANWPYQWNTGFRTIRYTEGTIVIDLIDTKTRQMVWRGSIEGQVANKSAAIEREISQAIHLIFGKYPQ